MDYYSNNGGKWTNYFHKQEGTIYQYNNLENQKKKSKISMKYDNI